MEKPKIENTHEYSDHDDDLGKEEANLQDSKVAEPPLKFEDIVHGATYDKMRPPKPGGKIITIIVIITIITILINYHNHYPHHHQSSRASRQGAFPRHCNEP